jgi:predicted metal-binding transcription factor (methanogenesis marker protein 9)
MKSNTNAILIDNYFGLLSSLSKENKLKLIAKLSNSIIDEDSENENIVDKFFGAFKSEKNAEELIKEIRESRTFNRTIEPFE